MYSFMYLHRADFAKTNNDRKKIKMLTGALVHSGLLKWFVGFAN